MIVDALGRTVGIGVDVAMIWLIGVPAGTGDGANSEVGRERGVEVGNRGISGTASGRSEQAERIDVSMHRLIRIAMPAVRYGWHGDFRSQGERPDADLDFRRRTLLRHAQGCTWQSCSSQCTDPGTPD